MLRICFQTLRCHFGGKPQFCIPEKSVYPLLNLYPALLPLCHHAILLLAPIGSSNGPHLASAWSAHLLLALQVVVTLKCHSLKDVILKFPI